MNEDPMHIPDVEEEPTGQVYHEIQIKRIQKILNSGFFGLKFPSDFETDFRHVLDRVFCTPIDFRVAGLASESLDFAHRHAGDANVGQCAKPSAAHVKCLS